MVIYGREVLRLTDCVLQTAGPVLKLSEAELAQLARVFADLRQQTTITPGFASACAYRAAMVLVDHMSHGSADRQRVDESPAPARLTLICRHIQTHLDADLSVESLAQRVGMTRWHFSRWFRKEKGVTPSDYVLNQRMRRATQLLSDPTTRIRDVAQACGYADAGYFGKVFDKYFGQSPRAFRNAGMFGP